MNECERKQKKAKNIWESLKECFYAKKAKKDKERTNFFLDFDNDINMVEVEDEDGEDDVEEIQIKRTKGKNVASRKGSSMDTQKSKSHGAFSGQSIGSIMSMGKQVVSQPQQSDLMGNFATPNLYKVMKERKRKINEASYNK